MKAKRLSKLSKGILLLQDNAPAHTSQVAVAAAGTCGFKILPHPLYSPDLAPSDFFLVPELKDSLRGGHFTSNDDVMAAVDDFLDDQDVEFFRTGLEKLEYRSSKCIEVKVDYIEK
eukprot:scpid29559/ scgid17022/ Histone-lysine N-methyltransferase SETMAR; SET domain and mariner transposase fusion gene-containing protein; Histone-lysine N-methyltransferase; Mariner transposase Hsmar1